MRNIVFRFDDAAALARALRDADQELLLPPGEVVGDGEWVLAIFELSEPRRATAAAAKGLHRGADAGHVLALERRDWERLTGFAERGETIPPARETTAPARAPLSAPRGRFSAAGASGPSGRILLVDDDRDIREVVGAMLDAVGLTVEAAPSAEDALEQVRASPFDLIVLDWNLPGMTGIELCRLIRRDTLLATLPVLFLTAHASSHDVVDAFASGADDYVVKPFRAPELGARIFGLLRRARVGQSSS